MTETTEHDAYSEALNREIRNSAQMLLDGRATQKTLASSLSARGYSADETAFIVAHAAQCIKELRQFQRQWHRLSDVEFIKGGAIALVGAAIFYVAFNGHIHGRGQGLLTLLVLLGLGSIAYGIWGQIKDTFNRILNR